MVIDNYRLGVRKRLGIDYAALKAINPRIISCSINAYGDTRRARGPAGLRSAAAGRGRHEAAQGGEDEPILHTIAGQRRGHRRPSSRWR